MNGAWTIADLPGWNGGYGYTPSPIVVPWCWSAGPTPICQADSPDRYRCTRRKSHTGRHAAILSDGQVYAVWPEPEPTA